MIMVGNVPSAPGTSIKVNSPWRNRYPCPWKKSEPTNSTPTTSPVLLIPKPVVFTGLAVGKSIVLNVPGSVRRRTVSTGGTIASYDVATGVDPRSVGEGSGRNIDGCELSLVQHKAVLVPIWGEVPADNRPRGSDRGSLGVRDAGRGKVERSETTA